MPGVGNPSSKPCRLCGGHDRNIVEPVRMYTTCWPCRKYPTRVERLEMILSNVNIEHVSDDRLVASAMVAVLDAKDIDAVRAVIEQVLTGEFRV